MELPNVGKPTNLLSILIPGIFLLFNAALLFSTLATESSLKNNQIALTLTNSGSLGFVIFLFIACFGYLLGVALRLLPAKHIDKLSGCILGAIDPKYARRRDFPYIRYLREVSRDKLSSQAKQFFEQCWEKRGYFRGEKSKGMIENTEFLNLCKIALLSVSKDLASECYAIEALNRYIASMAYALILSLVLACTSFILLWLRGSLSLPLLFLIHSYFLSGLTICYRYRFIR